MQDGDFGEFSEGIAAQKGTEMLRVLVLYEDVGAGHKRAADVICDVLRCVDGIAITQGAVSVVFRDPGVKLINRVWSFLLRRNRIRTADFLVNYFTRAVVVPVMEGLGTSSYHNRLAELAPDVIVCTADGFSKVLGSYAQKCGIPLYLVNTEVSVFQDQLHAHAVHLCMFPCTATATRSFSLASPYFGTQIDEHTSVLELIRYAVGMWRAHGLPWRWHTLFRTPDQTAVCPTVNDFDSRAIGPLVASQHLTQISCDTARNSLGIAHDRPCVLILSGSLGGQLVVQVLRAIQRQWRTDLTVVAVCGHDTTSRASVEQICTANPCIRVVALGYIESLAELYCASDAVIGRPSAGVFTESLVHRTPAILSAHTTKNDLGAVQLMRQKRLGITYEHEDEIPALLQDVLRENAAYSERIDRFLQDYPTSYAELSTTLTTALNLHTNTAEHGTS